MLENIALKYGTEKPETENTPKRKKRNENNNFLKSNQILEWVQYYEENLSQKNYSTSSAIQVKLGGTTVFPTDVNASISSLHHPWACSLRSKGFRGRHRCGVTLLSGRLWMQILNFYKYQTM